MANAFDFELVANDQVTATIHRIDEAVKKLVPQLDKTRDGLKLGGQESVEGLDSINDKLQGMGQFAREGVQFIGDLVPPLKMVGELGGKALKFGGMAAAGGYVIHGLAKGLGEAAGNAYQLDTAAKNAGMSVDNFSRISGAMQILGADSDSARQSVEGLYKTFNDPLWARNDVVQELLTRNGVVIERLKDGTADVYKTLDNVAKIFPKLAPQTQKTLADALGLDENLLTLMREGSRYKDLLAKADKFGLTVDPQTNAQLTELDRQLSEVSAAWDGLKQRGQNKLYGAILSDGSVKDGIEGVTDIVTNGIDSISVAHFLGLNRGKEADQLRRGYNDPEFYQKLSEWDKVGSDYGIMTDGYRKKYEQHYGPRDEQEKQNLAAPVNTPYMPFGEDQQQARLKQLESQYNLPTTILDRVYQAESGRGKNLLSPKGAQGPFQFMPPTGRDYGLNSMDDRMDFNKSSEAAAKYLSDLLKMFDGDVNKAVASYNWGQNNVKKYGLGQAPAETRNYLQKIMPGLPAIHPQSGELNTGTSDINASPPISINSSQQSGRDINDITQDMGGDKSEIEITLITDKTGERQKITAPKGAKISTSMNYPS
ncbi:lytic transglycosylase domain-containing protein [Yersinia enterocolitica]|uniref:lytic transglycosylase domain-containing protein n=1 Tax=Yersinia enterocolitica TaxID=630 RepID=UPI0005E348B8|nr:lytic transglycosylase domain-containing protein [Yersinia enterocolitica]EKN4829436.1 lytic transglycosylase domain-containing protein [Yersinia enterocolitica]EKN4851424.1 lytic transglycosylase domain-containing protein [Yersinia enterocolitica]EKN6354734.1 lytic transglycosylase domain-containing protein [Yersinia enterocolitica]ELI8049655.1 lytic transglycosylase domain-containing protein [Yersinia enterocolitica]ELI8290904.1 lytic transglycosylase domain-containing protein [Yersinia e